MQNIILANGEQTPVTLYQAPRGFSGANIAKNFSLWEFDCNGELLIAEPLLQVLQEFRNRINTPVSITEKGGGYRTEAYQKELRKRNPGAAGNSPHCKGMAADIDTSSNAQTYQYVKLLKQVALDLGIEIRLGYKQYMGYGSTFVHVDVCPMYFAPGKPFHETHHPVQWEQSIEW